MQLGAIAIYGRLIGIELGTVGTARAKNCQTGKVQLPACAHAPARERGTSTQKGLSGREDVHRHVGRLRKTLGAGRPVLMGRALGAHSRVFAAIQRLRH